MRHRSILLVEDDENDLFFIRDAFRRTGVDLPLKVARNGQEAIDFLTAAGARLREGEHDRPGLVLLDLDLPCRTGLEVLAWIRQQPSWQTLIVIVLTSSTSELDMRQAYSLGANSYLVKPADATRLREIANLLRTYWLDWNQIPSPTQV